MLYLVLMMWQASTGSYSVLCMMSIFLSKLVMAAALAMLLLVGDFRISSALHQNDAKRVYGEFLDVEACQGRQLLAKKIEFLDESLDKHGKETTVPFQSLRSSHLTPPPPSPTKARQTYMQSTVVPPPPPAEVS